MRSLGALTLLVRDYDEALAWFTGALGFVCIEDTALENGKRWLLIAPDAFAETRLLLAKASSDQQGAQIGHQAGGRVFLFLNTDDFDRDYRRMSEHGVRFVESPRVEAYGKVAVFLDLYGNKWDLLQARIPQAVSSER